MNLSQTLIDQLALDAQQTIDHSSKYKADIHCNTVITLNSIGLTKFGLHVDISRFSEVDIAVTGVNNDQVYNSLRHLAGNQLCASKFQFKVDKPSYCLAFEGIIKLIGILQGDIATFDWAFVF